MTQDELQQKLDELLALPGENEWLEYKTAGNGYDFRKLCKYVSALANEANLAQRDFAWLIMGVDNRKKIIGTGFRRSRMDLDSLKHEVAEKTTNRHTFFGIHELNHTDGRVLLFQIPAAPRGIPIAVDGHYFGREGESLKALGIYELELIRNQERISDWSEQIVEKATLNDLDPQAVKRAKEEYKVKNPKQASEVDEWDDATFLNKVKVTRKGKITNAAILLLGKEESEELISPAIGKVTWILKDKQGEELDYEHFHIPFILNSDTILAKIRNLKYRYMLDDTLFPTEVSMYDAYVIREALHNCFAHQDYSLRRRINLVEGEGELTFTNAGSFLPGTVERVIEDNAPADYYRNHFLAEAMVNLNMIDTIGSGIRRMFNRQKNRNFPLPSYDFSDPERVTLIIYGRIIDENYTRVLMNYPQLSLHTVLLLDKVQKNQSISKEDAALLKKEGSLIEGKYPNLYIAPAEGSVREQTFRTVIVGYLKTHESADRKAIDNLIGMRLPSNLTPQQRKNKVRNLLQSMSKKEGLIKNIGSDTSPRWVLAEGNSK